MKITKRRFTKEIEFKWVEGGQVFRHIDEYYMALDESIERRIGAISVALNAVRLSNGHPMAFNASDKVVIAENAELVVDN